MGRTLAGEACRASRTAAGCPQHWRHARAPLTALHRLAAAVSSGLPEVINGEALPVSDVRPSVPEYCPVQVALPACEVPSLVIAREAPTPPAALVGRTLHSAQGDLQRAGAGFKAGQTLAS